MRNIQPQAFGALGRVDVTAPAWHANDMIDIGKRIKELRSLKKLTQEDLADLTGLSRPYVAHIERGRKMPTIDTLQKIATALDFSIGAMFESEMLLYGAGSSRVRRVPILGMASAGKAQEGFAVSEDQEYVEFITDAKRVIAVVVDGNSIDRIIAEGSIAFIDLDDVNPVPNRFYLIRTEEGATLKQYTNAGGIHRFRAYSSDPRHDDIFMNQPLEVVGRIIHFQKSV